MARLLPNKRSSTATFRDTHPGQFNPDRLALTRGKHGIVIASICLCVFGLLYTIVRKNRSQAVDAAITLKMQRQKNPYVDRLLHVVSWPGFPPQSRLLPPAISASLWMLGFRLESVFQLMAWGTGLISFTVKRSMRRPRPEATAADTAIKVAAANIGGSSFPSGHVLNYIGVYGFLAFLANAWKLVGASEYDRIVMAVRIADQFTSDREGTYAFLGRVQAAWRSLLYQQAGVEAAMESRLVPGGHVELGDIVRSVNAVSTCIENLSANVRPRLALESMVLQWVRLS